MVDVRRAVAVAQRAKPDMELILVRKHLSAKATEGRLYVDGKHECFTLEDVVRDGPKIPGETAIPAGRYEVTVNLSNRFQQQMPLLLNVPGFEGVRIHTGNTDADTHGCILVGADAGDAFDDRIGNSKVAYGALFPKIDAALKKREKVWLTIIEDIRKG